MEHETGSKISNEEAIKIVFSNNQEKAVEETNKYKNFQEKASEIESKIAAIKAEHPTSNNLKLEVEKIEGEMNPVSELIDQRIEENYCFLYLITQSYQGEQHPQEFEEGDSHTYKGGIKDGKRCGLGLYTNSDGCYYYGCWDNDMFNGLGMMIHPEGTVFAGIWKDNNANGFGQIKDFTSHYIGDVVNNLRTGYGRETIIHDGSVYTGNIDNGVKTGYGELKTGGQIARGEYTDNNLNGQGHYVWQDGMVYEGGFKNHKMHGMGKQRLPDGRKYEGGFVHGKKEGHGVFEWPDNKCYDGEWFRGQQHGNGTYTTPDGKSRKGVWNFGTFKEWLD